MTSRSEEELSSLVVQGWMNVWGEFCDLFTVGDVTTDGVRTFWRQTQTNRYGDRRLGDIVWTFG